MDPDGSTSMVLSRTIVASGMIAVFPSAGTRWIFPELLDEGLEPHNVSHVYLYGSAEPDTWVDITETIDVKIQALREHHSQVGHDFQALTQRVRDRAAEIAAHCPPELGSMAYAEVFRRMTLRRPTTGTRA